MPWMEIKYDIINYNDEVYKISLWGGKSNMGIWDDALISPVSPEGF